MYQHVIIVVIAVVLFFSGGDIEIRYSSGWLTYHIEAVRGEVVDDPVEAVHGGTWQVGVAGASRTGDCGETRPIGNSH